MENNRYNCADFNIFGDGYIKSDTTVSALSSAFFENEYRKEMERLGIDLSWKSSQIEGNTYSLLETERLLRESKTADGKTKEEADMLLNHKDALCFIPTPTSSNS